MELTPSCDELAEQFEARTLPKAQWTHAAHLTVGVWHVHKYGSGAALARLRTGIRLLNAAHGTPNTDTDGYHETITAAYVQLLAQFDEQFPETVSLEQRASDLRNSPLAARDALLAFYTRDVLMSVEARRHWVPPDVRPLHIRRIIPARSSEWQPAIVNLANAEHYAWGGACDGWRLLARLGLAVAQERIPPGHGEQEHYHERARQLFVVLEGALHISVEAETFALARGDSLEVAPLKTHRAWNDGAADAVFLVISSPTPHGDRVNTATDR